MFDMGNNREYIDRKKSLFHSDFEEVTINAERWYRYINRFYMQVC